MKACPPKEIWQQWLHDVLSAEPHPELETHLNCCSSCQSVLDRLTTHQDWSWLAARSLPDAPPDAPARPPSLPGLTLLNEIGRGGHGVVYRAVQDDLDRPVAVKLLKLGFAASADEQSRLAVEAATLARLKHPNIVQVYSTGKHDGLPYVVMEWIDGGTLVDRLRGAPWPAADAARMVETLACAVEAAHSAGIVHRDLKPGNVLLARDGTPRIADFGLAKFIDVPTDRTPTIAILGTPSYMAPEQADGGSSEVGPTADVFALGAILYELLTGRPPFLSATPFETLLAVREADPIRPRVLQSRLPRDLETICLHSLHKNPDRRYKSAGELAADLERFRTGQPIQARPVGIVEKLWKWGRRHPSRVAALGVGMIALLALALVWINGNRRAEESRALALVDGLLAADAGAVRSILTELEPDKPLAAPYLASRYASAEDGSRAKLNAALGLLAEDATLADFLQQRALTATPDEVMLIARELQPFADRVLPRLWSTATDGDAERTEQFRASCALATLAPGDPRWRELGPTVADWLVAENALLLGAWTRALEPVRQCLIEPLSALAVESKRSESERIAACSAAAAYAAADPQRLVSLWLEADSAAARVLLPALRKTWTPIIGTLTREAREPVLAEGEESAKDMRGKRRMRAAVALWHAGRPDALNGLLAETGPDVRARYYAIHNLAALDVGIEYVIERIRTDPSAVVRRSALLALGEYKSILSVKRIDDLKPVLGRLFRDDPDPGVHSTVEWLVGQALEHGDWLAGWRPPPSNEPAADRRWYVAPNGTPMAIVRGPVLFRFGSAPSEPYRMGFEPRSHQLIQHDFAIATREVTVEEFDQFLKECPQPEYSRPPANTMAPMQPVRQVTWYQSLRYCRWLNEKEGVPEEEIPYPPLAELQVERPIVPPRFLTRTGYRLPTEPEWEYACRAGTETARFYGFDPEMLYRYAWLLFNANDRCRPGGQLRPNDLGIFDIYGNVWEWAQPAPIFAIPRSGRVMTAMEMNEPWQFEGYENPRFNVVARGGSYLYHAPFVRSGKRYLLWPAGDTSIGFRIARTMPAPKR